MRSATPRHLRSLCRPLQRSRHSGADACGDRPPRHHRAGWEDHGLAADEQVVWAEHQVVWAEHEELPLTLYVRERLADESRYASGSLWAGRGEIIGWDHRGGRLQVRVEG